MADQPGGKITDTIETLAKEGFASTSFSQGSSSQSAIPLESAIGADRYLKGEKAKKRPGKPQRDRPRKRRELGRASAETVQGLRQDGGRSSGSHLHRHLRPEVGRAVAAGRRSAERGLANLPEEAADCRRRRIRRRCRGQEAGGHGCHHVRRNFRHAAKPTGGGKMPRGDRST